MLVNHNSPGSSGLRRGAALCRYRDGGGGADFQVAVSFDYAGGANPDGALVQGANGNLYGTTFDGAISNYGTVFEMTSAGKLTTLYTEDLCRSSS
jgi:uncharacterized repeat protein (TIGR03803 family)